MDAYELAGRLRAVLDEDETYWAGSDYNLRVRHVGYGGDPILAVAHRIIEGPLGHKPVCGKCGVALHDSEIEYGEELCFGNNCAGPEIDALAEAGLWF